MMDVVFARMLGPEDARDYDAFVARARAGHHTQTRAWAEAFGRAPWRVPWYFLARREGAVVGAAVVLVPRLRVHGVSERGPVVDAVAELPQVLLGLRRVTRKRGIVHLAVMPYWSGSDARRVENALEGGGFHDVQTRDGPHAVSLRLPLDTRSESALTAGPAHKKLRYELRHGERSGVRVRRAGRGDTQVMEALDAALARSQKKRPRRARWFERMDRYLADEPSRGAFFLAEHERRPLAWALVLRHGAIAVYAAGASDPSPRPFSKMAQVVFAGACWARSEGALAFDVGGVPMDGDVDEKRQAIARFKYDFSKDRIPLVHQHARWTFP